MQHSKIKSIKKIERKDRYDLTMGKNHNFFANGILIHNTSARYGFFPEETMFSGWKKYFVALFARVFFLVTGRSFLVRENKLLTGSRRVQLKSATSETSFYGDEGFRFRVADKLRGNIRLGETVYGELVGYQDSGKLIMGAPSTKAIGDKSFAKQYGPEMVYKYGCPVGVSKFYVYRITQTSEDGSTVDLSVEQIKSRCRTLGAEYVPEICGPLVVVRSTEGLDRLGLHHPVIVGDGWGAIQSLSKLVEEHVGGPDIIDPSHIREGVVVRVDAIDGSTYFLKAKNFEFRVLEGIVKDDANYIDAEEAS